MSALQRHRVKKAFRASKLKSAGNVAILALLPVVWFRQWLMAVGTCVRDLTNTIMAAIALDAGVTAFQTDRMGKDGIQIYHWPG